jgi:phosphoribosylformimino-5-aminoimidazole carboxamide ribotide isomerase
MSDVELIPAIDIRGGRCVRLFKGDFEQETRYDVDPIERAGYYRALGARTLHIVDLDGAKAGRPVNLELIQAMASGDGMRIQLGGGVRTHEDLQRVLAVADRVVIGSLAVTSPDTVREWLRQYGGERFTLGFDIRVDEAGTPRVTTHGWTRDSGLSLADAIAGFLPAGLRHVLCTDVDRDGAMTGPNLQLYADCASTWPQIAFQASGGVRGAADLEALQATGVAGAISGKALLDGRFTEAEIRRFLPNA